MLTGFGQFLFEKMPPKQDSPVIPADATADEKTVLINIIRKERTVSKREFTRRKNILDKMMQEDPDPNMQDLVDITMNELLQQYHIVLEKNHDVEINLDEDVVDTFIDEISNGLKETQMRYIKWKKAGAPRATDAPPPEKKTDPFMSVVGLNFDVQKVFPEKFTGDDVRDYTPFRVNWLATAARLTEMGFTDAQKLMELKKCLAKEAYELVKRLPDEDAQYERAINLLDLNFRDNIKIAEMVLVDLLNTPKMTNSAESISIAYNAMIQADQTLDGLGVTDIQRGQLLFTVICVSKLNTTLVKLWTSEKNRQLNIASAIGHNATKDDLLKHVLEQKKLAKELERGRETTSHDSQKKKEEKKETKKDGGGGTLRGNFHIKKEERQEDSSRRNLECVICKKQGHSAADCFTFKNLKGGEERRKFLTNNKVVVCRNCLKGPHQTKDCRQSLCPIKNCGMRHHALLHEDRQKQTNSVTMGLKQTQGSSRASQGSSSEGDPSKTVTAVVVKSKKQPILQSCQAWAMSPSGEKFLARIFLDSGSELTLVRKDFSEVMGLQGPTTPLLMSVAGGSALPPTLEKKVKFQLQSMDGSYISPKMEGVTSPKIVRDLRSVNIDVADFEHLKGIDFTESYPRSEKEVDILIGVDHYTNLMKGQVVRGKPDEPMAISTKLGYVLSGSA